MINFIYGIISGIVTGMGMGGGTILIIFLTIFENINQKEAQCINLMFFIPTTLIAVIMYIKNKEVNLKKIYLVIIAGIVGATIGAIISQKLNTNLLKKIFAIVVIIIAIIEIVRYYMNNIKKVRKNNKYKSK